MARVACIFSIFSVTGVHWVVTEERLTLFVGGGTRFQPAIRQVHLLGETHAAARFVDHAWRVFDSRVELADLAVHIGQALAFHKGPAGGAAHRESFQIPGDVLAQIVDGHHLIALIKLGKQLGMTVNHAADLAQIRVEPFGIALEGVFDVGEQPRPALASAADGHTVAAGLAHHFERILGTPDIAIAEYRNVEVFLELADAGPVGMTAILFGGGTGMQGYGLAALLLRDVSGFEEGLMVMVDADADLRGDGDARRLAYGDHAL